MIYWNMKTNKEIKKIKLKIVPVLEKNGVKKAGIFGSYATGEQKKNSDVDILIEVPKGRKFSLLDLVGLQFELEKILKKKVDLLTYKGLSPYLKKYIMAEEIKII